MADVTYTVTGIPYGINQPTDESPWDLVNAGIDGIIADVGATITLDDEDDATEIDEAIASGVVDPTPVVS